MNNDPLIGRQFANYKIESVLGRGGMAVVYFARDVSLQRPVAVKVIDAQFRQNVSYAQRFISEAQAVATWRHENIIQVYYASQEDDLYYFVMEYIDGLDLEGLLQHYAEEGELMPHPDVIQIGKAVASALDYAHQRGVIHRDIKPSNVMISSDNRVVLTDFGLALDTQQGSLGEVFGTPHYVSPEQARRSADAVPQSDLYSLGVMLFEMLTGVVPFDDPSAASIALQHLATPPPSPRSLNPSLNQATEDVLLKILEKEHDERYLSGAELLDHLEKALQQPTDKLATAELPPLPPGMESPNRSLSSQTIMDRVALHIHSTLTQPKPDPPRILETNQNLPAVKSAELRPSISQSQPQVQAPPPEKTRSMSPVVIGVVLLGIVILAGGLLFASGALNQSAELPTAVVLDTDVPETQVVGVDNNQTDPTLLPTDEDTSTPIPTATDLPSATPVSTETTVPTDNPIVLTDTPIPATNTLIPSDTPIPATSTLIPSNTPIPPTNTLIPSNTPIPATNTPIPPTDIPLPLEPTVLYPEGQAIQFIWDDNSFYWANSTGGSLPVSSIAFEALSPTGFSAGFAFEGSRWTVGFRSVENGKCDGIEITTRSPALRPPQCRGYNSLVTPQLTSPLIFWIIRENVPQFRVIWNGEEVARCTIEDGFCEAYIP